MNPSSSRVAIAAALLVVLLLATTGCTLSPPDEPPGITGTVSNLTPGDGDVFATMLVQGDDQPSGAVSDKAQVTVERTTQVFSADGKIAGGPILKEGTVVRVWFTGPVAESYPVQGTASAIQIVNEAK